MRIRKIIRKNIERMIKCFLKTEGKRKKKQELKNENDAKTDNRNKVSDKIRFWKWKKKGKTNQIEGKEKKREIGRKKNVYIVREKLMENMKKIM